MFQKMGIHDPASIIFEIKAIKSLHDLFFLRGLGGGGVEMGVGGSGGGGGGDEGGISIEQPKVCVFFINTFLYNSNRFEMKIIAEKLFC